MVPGHLDFSLTLQYLKCRAMGFQVTSANVTYILISCHWLDCKNNLKAFVVEIS